MLNNADTFASAGISLANNFMEKLEPSLGLDDKDISLLVAGATNIIFSIELYLKAFHYLNNNGEHPAEHDIWKLFKNLPQNSKEEIEREFDKHSDKEGPLGSFVFTNISQSSKEEYKKLSDDVNKMDLKKTLLKHANGFLDWRYAHQQKYERNFHIDFGSLERLVQALRKIMIERLMLSRMNSDYHLNEPSKPMLYKYTK